ncbi:DHA2 family efflux MFS transporter permease subunit [Paenibacillus sp. KQZ6P-2]|uniref:DHA2 family efflux MFS transporter permease subunit n=1 Tax=Paenibacillus mangrovi TaxID=2931978 RepID=A0A9X1WU19_9BACL|nr:DHA2 family efflux MFS transporter permease subunit [Paenibacillus mangrovi]MCJ8013655.1 DHA2 family efflux MFS transporter permease subunit [Paenibacillus mangrovi]
MAMKEPIGTIQRRGLLLTFLCFGLFMVYLDTTIVNVALPDIQIKLNADMSVLQWIIDAYALTFSCLLLSAGTIGDAIGRKKVFITGLLGFSLTSIVCAVSPSIEMLLVGRILQGVFGSFMIPVSLAIIRGIYEEPVSRAKAIGIWAGIGGIAFAAGPVVGGWLVEYYGWQSIFWINVPIGIVIALVLVRILHENRSVASRKFDIIGQTLFILAIGALSYALIEGNSLGWDSGTIITTFIVAAIALLLFVFQEYRYEKPLLPLSLFRNRIFTIACSVNFLGLFGLYGAIFLLTLYLQNINHFSPIETGIRFLALTAAIMVASFFGSVLAAKVSPRLLIVIGLLMAGGGLLALIMLDVGSSYGTYWWALVLLGIGVSLVGSSATVALMTTVPPEIAGTTSGVSNTFRQVGAVFGVALSGALVSQYIHTALPSQLATMQLPDEIKEQISIAFSRGDMSLSQVDPVPEDVRQLIQSAGARVFVDGIHLAFLVSGTGTLLAGICALLFMGRIYHKSNNKASMESIQKIGSSSFEKS